MRQVEPLPGARYAVFYCADVDNEGVAYYESMALADCYHPQTILAYALNDAPLDIPHGAPLRLRFERQLGYKQPKIGEGGYRETERQIQVLLAESF